jgi:hypothetical protein
MKKIILSIVFIFCAKAYAQTPIINLTESEFPFIAGAYYKDLNNYLNPYIGTWEYNNGSGFIFTLKLRKVEMNLSGHVYEDMIVGEYRIVKNGVEIINTLNDFNTVYSDERNHNVDGNTINEGKIGVTRCPECSDTEKWITLILSDDLQGIAYDLATRPIDIAGQEVLRIYVSTDGLTFTTDTGNFLQDLKNRIVAPGEHNLPTGYLNLVKQ